MQACSSAGSLGVRRTPLNPAFSGRRQDVRAAHMASCSKLVL